VNKSVTTSITHVPSTRKESCTRKSLFQKTKHICSDLRRLNIFWGEFKKLPAITTWKFCTFWSTNLYHLQIVLTPVLCIIYYFVQQPTNVQLIYKLLYCSHMFRHYCVILRELAVSTLLSYTSMSMQLLVIQYKISRMFYAVEISMFKIFGILKSSYNIVTEYFLYIYFLGLLASVTDGS